MTTTNTDWQVPDLPSSEEMAARRQSNQEVRQRAINLLDSTIEYSLWQELEDERPTPRPVHVQQALYLARAVIDLVSCFDRRDISAFGDALKNLLELDGGEGGCLWWADAFDDARKRVTDLKQRGFDSWQQAHAKPNKL